MDSLLEEYVDEDTAEGDEVTLDSSVGSRWQTYTDDGGDVAYATEQRGSTLLVWGSAPREDIEAMIGTLTDRPSS